MRWFEGSIPAAIATAKQRKSVFVVVITGSDDQSRQLMSSWETAGVSEVAQNSCVAIHVDAQSETCVQFSQIYPVVCVPSSFFIGENGIPLEVIAGSVTEDELKRRISRVIQMQGQQTDAAEMHTQTAEQPAVSKPQEALNTTSSSAATSKESLSVRTEGGASGAEVEPKVEAEKAEEQPGEGLDVKVERLTKKLEERREQKKKAEDEKEIQKEVDRRKLGKEMLEYKKQQEEEKTRRLLEERNREKMEERAARERVKQQIALDRADRAARYAQNQQEVEAARVAALQARAAEQEAKRDATQRERSAVARIQFRLPDGSSFTNQFPSETRLQEARQFAVQEVGNRYGQFTLATMFPRREFTDEDLQRSLLELELTPSASIVLLPQWSGAGAAVVRSSSSSSSVWSVFSSLLFPLLAVWRFISALLFSPTQTHTPAAGTHTRAFPPAATGSSTDPQRDAVRKRVLEKRPEDFKKDGKIYRLRTPEDSEDDNNTWNGNSTQQM
ncbi:UBX domain-containing protein 4 [Danio rerio]|uniref:UBX domain-containing protein 4 n=1 Tax=Danio rerio TaxID=7955 RepID=Q6P267_DANRE|nr:UBX domain-containing protein 4 [Danio rerio]AAH64707.3 UBX domain protein 4 [Danio rerio]|eukprot:NP_998206.1 UBX domain-containing protein 4 [Danio rerio]